MRNYAIYTLSVIALLVTGCASRPTQFTLDPEVYSASIAPSEGKTFKLDIIVPTTKPIDTENTQYLEAANDFSRAIKSSVIDSLSEKGFNVSSNKHFSDFILTLDFSQFEVAIHTGLVKDKLEVTGQLIAKVSKKQRSYQKTFRRNQTLIVALKTTDIEITGLTNQVAGHLLKSALNDPEMVSFINNI